MTRREGSRWGVPTNRIPVSQLVVRGPGLDAFEDPTRIPSSRRIRDLAAETVDEEALSMCTIVRARDGGPLRTFNGGLSHENGWYCSAKARRLLHWEGETAVWFLQTCEVDHQVVDFGSEAIGFEFPLAGRLRMYTADVELVDARKRSTVVEVKRTEHDLADPEYRMVLAYVAEVCRRCGMDFRIVYRADLFRSIVHRRNVGLFASRGRVHVGASHHSALAAHRRRHGSETSYGALANAFEPGHPAAGRAVAQALLVRRRLTMDLSQRLDDESPVLIV